MAKAPITGEYPSEKNTPALTLPFARTAVGAPITLANLRDKNHPINIQNVSGKVRGATVLLDDDSIYMALGHKASDGWKNIGEGGGGTPGGEGTVKSVNGVEPDANGDVTIVIPAEQFKGTVTKVNGKAPNAAGEVSIPVGTDNKGTVTSVNGVEPDAAGALKLNVVTTVNGNGPDASGNINVQVPEVHNLSLKYGGDVATYALTEADRDKLILFSHTGEVTVTLSKAIVNSDSPLKIFYLQNTQGPIRVAVEAGEALYAYSNYVEAKAIAGCIRIAGAWSVAGCNTAPEDQ